MVSGDSAIDPKVCQEACVGENLRQYIRESHVYRIIWKPLVGEFLPYVEKLTNEVEKNTVAAVCTNSHHKRRWLAVQQNISMIVFMFLSLLCCALDIFATVKCVNHGSEYGLKIFANIYLYGPEKFIKLAKK